MKKAVIEIEDITIAYGYANKREAIKAIEQKVGFKPEAEYLTKRRVLKFKNKDGEDYYFWGDTCNCCGRKNDGIVSYIDNL